MATKCSFENCYKHFESRVSMIKHKMKDPMHSYCKKCDHDAKDDTELLIHQITSPRHSESTGERRDAFILTRASCVSAVRLGIQEPRWQGLTR